MSTPARIAFVHTGSFYHLACLSDPALIAYDLVDLYAPEMTSASLDGVDAVYVAARLHPGVVERIAPILVAALDRPGLRMAVDGENAVGAWMPGVAETPRGTNFWAWRVGEDVGRRSANLDHPMHGFFSERALHWHYHGVLAPPPGATPLVVLEPVPDGERRDPWGTAYTAIEGHPNVVMYHDDASYAAEVLVSTMDAAYHHGSGFMPGASQLLYRQMRWLAGAAI